MCGRYTSSSTVAELAEVFALEEIRTEELPARYNVAPTQQVYAVALSRSGDADSPLRRALGTFRWGLVPSWAAEPSVGNRMINARAEGITTKPAYRRAVARRRCLIPADAFYEWQRRGDPGGAAGKLPHAVRRRDGRPMALAGVWEVWRDRGNPGGAPLRTCAIITTAANPTMAPIHDRMPVVLEEGQWSAWLDPSSDLGTVESMLAAPPEGILEAYPVGSRVNSVANEGPELLEPLPQPPGAPGATQLRW